ncbi:MAG: BPL-N domain-containing protein, partial [Verrucomicrobiota bacterium]
MKVRPDWTIDIHEGFDFHRSHNPSEGKKKSVGSSVIYQGSESMDALMKRVVAAADTTVTDPEKRFSLIRNGPVSTGFARACIRVMGAEGVILETTYKNQPMSLRTRQHRAMVNELLNHIGLIDTDCRNLLAGAEKGEKLQVAVLDGTGVGSSSLNLGDVIDDAPGLELCHVGPAEMKVEVLEQFDVLVFPGGSGSKQAAAIGENGRLSVRQYVERGGGVLGICAGAYLCSSHYQWSLNLIDSSVLTGTAEIPGKGRKQLWFRGPQTDIDIELSPAGERMFAGNGIARNFVVRYANGPIISPKQRQELEDYEVLAWFRSENGLWKPQEGTMINTPAIVSGRFGKGRVMSMSPHPELTPSLHPIITEAIRWVAGPEK